MRSTPVMFGADKWSYVLIHLMVKLLPLKASIKGK